jgi:hypothetical protein
VKQFKLSADLISLRRGEEKMSSLFTSRRSSPEMLRLPAFCIPAGNEPEHLRAKREAQLSWMRDKGVTYLGNPISKPTKAELAPLKVAKAG